MKYQLKSKLNSIESITSKVIQELYFLKKDYVFINEEANRYNKLKEQI